MTTQNYVIKRLGQDTIDRQIEVFREAFSHSEDISATRTYWVKKHFQNPLGESYIFGAFDGDLLVGLNAFLPMEYCFQGTYYRLLQSCESGVRPTHRRKGVWAQLMCFAMDYFEQEGMFDALIGFPNIKNSYHGFLKLGWHHVCSLDNYLMVHRGSQLMRVKLKNKLLSRLGRIFEIQKICLFLSARTPQNATWNKGWLLTFIDNNHSHFFLSRRSDVFQWKQSYQGMQSVVLQQENTVLASCYYAKTPFRGAEMIRVLSLETKHASRKEQRALAAACICHIMKIHPEAGGVRIWGCSTSPIVSVLKKLLFIRSKHQNPFIVYPLNPSPEQKTLLLDEKNWAPSFVDLD